jgi:hypothetical protein
MPEAYQVHCDIIQWNARYSEDRIPDQAVGVDPMTAKLMRWTMQSWKRVAFMNRYLAGTLAPRIQLDLIPGLLCAAHFILLALRRPESIDDYVDAGRGVQRFWLTATKLGLFIQPEMTPLIFNEYIRDKVHFSSTTGMNERAEGISRRFAELAGEQSVHQAVFMGRIGAGPAPKSRSLRRPLEELVL